MDCSTAVKGLETNDWSKQKTLALLSGMSQLIPLWPGLLGSPVQTKMWRTRVWKQ